MLFQAPYFVQIRVRTMALFQFYTAQHSWPKEFVLMSPVDRAPEFECCR